MLGWVIAAILTGRPSESWVLMIVESGGGLLNSALLRIVREYWASLELGAVEQVGDRMRTW